MRYAFFRYGNILVQIMIFCLRFVLIWKYSCSNSMSNCKVCKTNDRRSVGRFSDPDFQPQSIPMLFTQAERNDLVRDLN